MSVVKWWVDTSYVVYEYCWGHMGSRMYLGKGAVSRFSTKRKINGNISKKGELIGVDNAMEKYYGQDN